MKPWTLEAEVAAGEVADALDELLEAGADLRVRYCQHEAGFMAVLTVPQESTYYANASTRREVEGKVVANRAEILRAARAKPLCRTRKIR